MYRARSKRNQRIRLLLTYTIMPVIIAGVVTALVYYTLGYRLNTDRNTVVQGGLVQFDSYPSGAKATIGQQSLLWRTATSANIESGTYVASLQRDGYQAWQKTVTVMPGQILWLDYARLLPKNIKSRSVTSWSKVDSVAYARESDVISVINDAQKPEVTILTNLSSGKPNISQFKIASTAYTVPKNAQSSQFELKEMSRDGRWITILHKYDDKTEWLAINRTQPNETRNLTMQTSLAIESLRFDPARSSRLLAQSSANLYRFDVMADAAPQPLATSISKLHINPAGIISFLIKDPTTESSNPAYVRADNDKVVRISGSDGLPLKGIEDVLLSDYKHGDFVVLVHNNKIEINSINIDYGKILDSQLNEDAAKLELSGGYDQISLSPNGRIVLIQAGSNLRTYDRDLKKLSAITQASDSSFKLGWLDDFIIWSNLNGVVTLREFDGENSHIVSEGIDDSMLVLSENQEYLYGLRSDQQKVDLVRFDMLVR